MNYVLIQYLFSLGILHLQYAAFLSPLDTKKLTLSLFVLGASANNSDHATARPDYLHLSHLGFTEDRLSYLPLYLNR